MYAATDRASAYSRFAAMYIAQFSAAPVTLDGTQPSTSDLSASDHWVYGEDHGRAKRITDGHT